MVKHKVKESLDYDGYHYDDNNYGFSDADIPPFLLSIFIFGIICGVAVTLLSMLIWSLLK